MTRWRSFLVGVVVVVGGFCALSADIERTYRDKLETSMLSQPLGCVGDWVSGGLYCHRFTREGYEVASRAY